jgi:shikimate kinase
MDPESIIACIIMLNGFPGVGKYTIAKSLRGALTDHNVPTRLLDNHLLLDHVSAIWPIRDATHYHLRSHFRHGETTLLKRIPGENLVIVMTSGFSAESKNDVRAFAEYADVARKRNVPVVFVSITCEERENRVRLRSEERKEVVENGRSTKLIDEKVLADLKAKYSLLCPTMLDDEIEGLEVHYLEIDNTDLSVEDSTKKIVEFVKDCKDWDAFEKDM